VFATLNRPIITDYVPAARPPWLVLAFVIVLLSLALPRHVVPLALSLGVLAGVAAGLLLQAVGFGPFRGDWSELEPPSDGSRFD
jgi:hypothetical protein